MSKNNKNISREIFLLIVIYNYVKINLIFKEQTIMNKLTNEEKIFLEKNIKNYKDLDSTNLIEQLEDYMQTKININNIEELSFIENIIDKLVD